MSTKEQIKKRDIAYLILFLIGAFFLAFYHPKDEPLNTIMDLLRLIFAVFVLGFSGWKRYEKGDSLKSIFMIDSFLSIYCWFTAITFISMAHFEQWIDHQFNTIIDEHLFDLFFLNYVFWFFSIIIILIPFGIMGYIREKRVEFFRKARKKIKRAKEDKLKAQFKSWKINTPITK